MNKLNPSFVKIKLFLILSFLLCMLFSPTYSQDLSKEHKKLSMKDWKHKQNREEFALIFSGEADQAIEKMNRRSRSGNRKNEPIP